MRYVNSNIELINDTGDCLFCDRFEWSSGASFQADCPKDFTFKFSVPDQTTTSDLQSLFWDVDDAYLCDRNGTVLFTGTYDDCLNFLLQQEHKRTVKMDERPLSQTGEPAIQTN